MFSSATSQRPSYVPVCEIAQGGMGFVEVVVRAHLRADPGCRASFMDEARLAGMISAGGGGTVES